jgi:GAF domain-containing protein
MRRRSRAGGEPVKTPRRKTAARNRGNAPKAGRNRSVSIAGQETVVARLTRERDEALLRETANSEILRLISKSPGDLELVFRTILENATRICNANFGNLFRFDGENLYPVAQFNTPAALLEAITRRGPFKPIPGISLDHVMRTKQVFHSADTAAEPVHGLSTKLGGARTQVTVPMLKDDALIGAILIYRQEVRPFTEKQIELLKNFAAQAVIAIENTRLLSELRQRTTDLTESLERQTATSEVLCVISSSPGALEPVFDSVLENATHLCQAKFGNLYLCEGDAFRTIAMYNMPPAFAEVRRRDPLVHPTPGNVLARLAKTRCPVNVPDCTEEPAYIERNPLFVTAVELGRFRAVLAVPMLKDETLVGAILIYRQESNAFTDKQIELVQNFAAQAVIAIENARLLNELRQRTDDLTESLEQQTATSEVLKVISGSPGDLAPVFHAMLENATRICEATFGSMLLREGDAYRRVAMHNAPPNFEEFSRNAPVLRPGIAAAVDRVIDTRQVSHILDVATEDPNEPIAKFAGARTLLVVPMLKDNEAIGVLGIYRQEVRSFTNKQIALVQNFANQAVIAIENTRLLNELRESLDRQTATADILRVIAGTPEDSKRALDTIAETASRMCRPRQLPAFRGRCSSQR